MSMNLEQAEQIVMNLWDEDARAWRRYWAPIFRRFAEDLIFDSGLSQGQLVLDIGTGTGVAAFEAARRVKSGFVFGIDRSKSMLADRRAEPNARFRNVRFFLMDAQELLFPNQMFDVAVSNCGISPVGFRQTVAEVYRVLRNGGAFAYSDWRLKDVEAHKIFSETLQKYRTTSPSKKLSLERAALATFERVSNHEMNSDQQVRELRIMGFERAKVKTRNYRIALDGIQGYLDMRLKRATLKRELRELPSKKRRELLRALGDELTQFLQGGRFLFEWKVTFVRAKKT